MHASPLLRMVPAEWARQGRSWPRDRELRLGFDPLLRGIIARGGHSIAMNMLRERVRVEAGLGKSPDAQALVTYLRLFPQVVRVRSPSPSQQRSVDRSSIGASAAPLRETNAHSEIEQPGASTVSACANPLPPRPGPRSRASAPAPVSKATAMASSTSTPTRRKSTALAVTRRALRGRAAALPRERGCAGARAKVIRGRTRPRFAARVRRGVRMQSVALSVTTVRRRAVAVLLLLTNAAAGGTIVIVSPARARATTCASMVRGGKRRPLSLNSASISTAAGAVAFGSTDGAGGAGVASPPLR